MNVSTRDSTPAFITRDGSQIRELMQTIHGARHQSLAEATVLPGQKTQTHFHAQSEELYHVLSGRGRVSVDDETREVAPGDTVLIQPFARHAIECLGSEALVFLCCCAPPYTHEDTFISER